MYKLGDKNKNTVTVMYKKQIVSETIKLFLIFALNGFENVACIINI